MVLNVNIEIVTECHIVKMNVLKERRSSLDNSRKFGFLSRMILLTIQLENENYFTY